MKKMDKANPTCMVSASGVKQAHLGLKHRHLEAFRAVIRAGSVTGAGRLLGLTQPGVSKLIGQTEELCSFPLFDRIQGRLVPTPRAHRLFEEAERMFVGMEEVNRLIDRLRGEGPARTVIAGVPLLVQELLPRVITEWMRVNDDNRFFVTTRDSGGVLAMVSVRHAEIGLTTSVRRMPGIRSHLIARTRTMCALPEGHPLLDRDVLRPIDLHGQQYIALSRHEGQQTRFDLLFENEGARPREMAEVPLIVGAAAMAHAGLGMTFADALSARPFLGRGLHLRDFEPTQTFEYHLIRAEGWNTSFDFPAFLKLLRATARSVITETLRLHTADRSP